MLYYLVSIAISMVFLLIAPVSPVNAYQLDPSTIYSHGADPSQSSLDLTNTSMRVSFRDSNGFLDGIASACPFTGEFNTYFNFIFSNGLGQDYTVWGGDGYSETHFNFPFGFKPVSVSMAASKSFSLTNDGTSRILGPICDSAVLLSSADETSPLSFVVPPNSAPHIDPIPLASINESDIYAYNNGFADSDDSTSWSANVDYGDGSGIQPLPLTLNNFALSHQYTHSGNYTVVVSVTDNQGLTGYTTGTITVHPVYQFDPTDLFLHGLTYSTSEFLFTDSSMSITLRDVNGSVGGLAAACSSVGDTFFQFTLTDNNGVTHTAWGGDGYSTIAINYPTDFVPVSLRMQASKSFTFVNNGNSGQIGPVCDSGVLISSNDGVSPLAYLPLLNRPPFINTFTNTTIPVGSTYSTNSSFSDTSSTSWTGNVDYGDGSGIQALPLAGNNFTLSHQYNHVGVYVISVNITDNQGATGTRSVSLTVFEPRQITTVSPAKVWVGLKNSDDVGVKFDLLAEVYKDSTLITSGKLDSVPSGSNGFNNAKLDTITFNPFSPVDFPERSQLSIKLYARNSCTGSAHNSGFARLWYNDTQANSQFGVTILGTNSAHYMLDNSLLGLSTGISTKTIDIQSGAKCSAFKLFGTWSTIP